MPEKRHLQEDLPNTPILGAAVDFTLMKQFIRRHRHDLVALLVLALATTLFHAGGLKPGQTFLPVDLANNNPPWRDGPLQPLQNPLITDPLYQFYPFLQFAIDTVEAGSWPLWNPHIFLGHPVIADPIAQPFYPVFVLLGVATGAARAISIGLWFHILLAGFFTYGFLRALRLNYRAALLGALIFALSGYLVTWFETLFWTSTLAWLPGVLLAFELGIQRRNWALIGLAGLILGIAYLAGQLTFALTFAIFLVLYAVGRAMEQRPDRRAGVWAVMAAIVAAAIGALISAVQILPFDQFLALSHRVAAQGLRDPLPASQLISLLIPGFFGNPTSIGDYWGYFNFSEGTIYTGMPALLLALIAPFFAQRRFLATYLLLLSAIVLYFAVGGPGVELLATFPGIKYLSLHRTLFLLPLLIGTLAAMTLDSQEGSLVPLFVAAAALFLAVVAAYFLNLANIQTHMDALFPYFGLAALVLAATVLLFTLGVRQPSWQPWTQWALIALVYFELFLLGARFNPTGPIEQLMPETPAIEFLKENAPPYRIAPYSRGSTVVMGPNIPTIFELAQGGGYSSIVPMAHLVLAELGDPTGRHWNWIGLSDPSTRLLDLLQVRYVIWTDPVKDVNPVPEHLLDSCESTSGQITADHPLNGLFSVRNSAVNRLDFRFRVLSDDPGNLVVRMWSDVDRHRQMLEEQIDGVSVADGQWTTIYFAPELDAPGKTYAWEISSQGPSETSSIALCTDSQGQPATALFGSPWRDAYDGEVAIQERLSPLPRAFVAYAVENVWGRRPVLVRLMEDTFDVRNVVINDRLEGLPVTPPRPADPAKITHYGLTEIEIQATAREPGILVLGDQYHPGWTATLDGQDTEVLQVNQVWRGVVLPAGTHTVTFRFQPDSLRLGGALSLLGVALVAILIGFGLFRSRHRST